MLIFDGFPTRLTAESFAARVGRDYSLAATVYDDADKAARADYFPFKLVAPCVLVERPDDDHPETELEVERLVRDYGGTFAGT